MMAQVVVISQDDTLHDVLLRQLVDRGHAVVQEMCPAERTILRRWRAAFVDLTDSGMFGVALVAEIRSLQPRCRIAVIDAVRETTGQLRIALGLAAGADDFLGKPVSDEAAKRFVQRFTR